MRFLIAHAEWRKDRRASLARLLEQLRSADVGVVASLGREHAAIWARRLWEVAADVQRHCGEHVCLLNDDVVLRPGFLDKLERIVAAVADEPLSLHCTNPHVLPFAAQGHAWVRAYHYTGPAVVLPPGAAEDLCRFVYDLPWSFLSRTNEDNIANAWAWERQRPFWYALPSPVTHDTSVPSTLGYDAHPHRTPVVLEGPEPDWTVRDRHAVPFVELSWAPTQLLAQNRRALHAGGAPCAWCLGSTLVVNQDTGKLEFETRTVAKGDTTICFGCLKSASAFADAQHEGP